MTEYECELCKKQFKAKKSKWSHWTRCDCGGKAFDLNRTLRVTPMTPIK